MDASSFDEPYTIIPDVIQSMPKGIASNWAISAEVSYESQIAELKEEIRVLTQTISDMKETIQQMRIDTYDVVDYPEGLIKLMVKYYAKNIPKGEPIYPSDVAEKYRLDPEKVEEVMDALVEEGFFK